MLYTWTLTQVLQVESACLFKAPTLIQGLFLRTTADLQGQIENEAPLEKQWKKTNEIPPKMTVFFCQLRFWHLFHQENQNCSWYIQAKDKHGSFIVFAGAYNQWSFLVPLMGGRSYILLPTTYEGEPETTIDTIAQLKKHLPRSKAARLFFAVLAMFFGNPKHSMRLVYLPTFTIFYH